MSPRLRLVFDLVLIACLVGGVIVLGISGVLVVGGAFSWVWLARLILVAAIVALVVEVVVLQRSMRVNHVRGPLGTWRLTDRTQGCTFALLGGVLVVGLLLCGGILEFLSEWR